MNKVNEILTEWTYQLESGYPKKDEDYIVLQNILQESTDFDQSKIHQIVDRARGLQEDDFSSPHPADFMDSEESFSNFLYQHYVYKNQEIQNLNELYNRLMKTTNSDVFDIISNIKTPTPGYTLTRDNIEIKGAALELYNICKVIKIPGGHWSELFFAFVFNGKVKSNTYGDQNEIKTDVILTNPIANVSVKAYSKTNYDCGTLPKGAYPKLKKFIALGELLTGIDMESSSMSTIDINKILNSLASEHLQDEIKDILKQQDSSFALMRNAAQRIKNIIGDTSPDYLENIIDSFCNDLDETLKIAFVDIIDWWALFNTSNNTLFLRPSSEIYEAVRCKTDGDRISSAIPNFHQGKVWLKGTSVGVTSAQYKDEG